MSEILVFRPPRRRGIIFHAVVILVLGTASVLAFLFGLNQQAGTAFVLLLLLALVLFAPLPLALYRLYALLRAAYWLERDGLRLRWGLRAEDIPLPEIEWVRRAADLATDLPQPFLSAPGALLGSVQAADLGPVEYMASTTHSLVLIATPERVYAISPEDPEAFVRAFQRSLEMGSLTPISSASVLPAAYLALLWADRIARWLLVGGFVLAMLLFVLVSLAIPTRASASIGFYPDGSPLPAGPSTQLMLLPILGAFAYGINLAAGMFFYRRQGEQAENGRMIAYITWGSGVITALLLIAAVLFILSRSPV